MIQLFQNLMLKIRNFYKGVEINYKFYVAVIIKL